MIALVWLWPAYWPLLSLLPLLAFWLHRRGRSAQARSDEQLGANGRHLVGAPAHRRLRHGLGAAATALLGAVLLQPVGTGAAENGADVVFCVDASWSMAARDVAPSRWQRVQQELAAFATVGAGARAGLVVFAGSAELRCPLTTDLAAVAAMVQEVVPGTTGRGGTDPGAAIERAAALLAHGGRGGAIVLCSDGEDFVGRGAPAAAAARAAGFVVHCCGLGDPAGSKIVVEQDGEQSFLRAADGSEVVSRLELAGLQAIAAAGGGRCEVAAALPLLPALYEQHVLPAAQAAALRSGRLQPEHRHHALLLAAILLWMLGWCLPERRR